MPIKTQGTDLFVIDPDDDSIMLVGCVTSIDGIDTTIDEIDTTCLSDTTRTYEAGLGTPGVASFEINTDPSNQTHLRLHQLKISGTTLKWVVGWSESPGTAPTGVDSQGDFVLPGARSWIAMEGYMNSYPFGFAQNNVVKSSIGIKISGEPTLVPKSA